MLPKLTQTQLKYYKLIKNYFSQEIIPLIIVQYLGIIPKMETFCDGDTIQKFEISEDDTLILTLGMLHIELWNLETGIQILRLPRQNGIALAKRSGSFFIVSNCGNFC